MLPDHDGLHFLLVISSTQSPPHKFAAPFYFHLIVPSPMHQNFRFLYCGLIAPRFVPREWIEDTIGSVSRSHLHKLVNEFAVSIVKPLVFGWMSPALSPDKAEQLQGRLQDILSGELMFDLTIKTTTPVPRKQCRETIPLRRTRPKWRQKMQLERILSSLSVIWKTKF